MADLRTGSAKFKRAEQLKRWENSETNKQSVIPKRPSKINFSFGCVFLAACAAAEKDEVLQLLSLGADINTTNVDGLTALHQACIDDNLDMVEFLLKCGADLNLGDNEGWTPLHAVASCGFISVARFLLENGADAGAVNCEGELPIDIIETCNYEMQDLIRKAMDEKGIDPEYARSREERILMQDTMRWASGDTEGMDFVDPKSGGTPLHVAAAKGYIEIMAKLIKECHIEVDPVDFDGWTPLLVAALFGQVQAVSLLLEHGADADIKNYANQSVFDLVDEEMAQHIETVKSTLPPPNKLKKVKRIEPIVPKDPEIIKADSKPEIDTKSPTENNVNLKRENSVESSDCETKTEQRERDTNLRSPLGNSSSPRRSFVPPVSSPRDDESETQRKAHAKRVRETRRSTQGVTFDEIKSAEQLTKKKAHNSTMASSETEVTSSTDAMAANTKSPKYPRNLMENDGAVTVTLPLNNCASATISHGGSERRPSWRLRLDPGCKFELEDASTPTASPTVAPVAETTVTLPLRLSTGAVTSKRASQTEENESEPRIPLSSVQRRRRPKRRSTGVGQFDFDEIAGNDNGAGGEGDYEPDLTQSGPDDLSSKPNSFGSPLSNSSSEPDTDKDKTDYRELWETAVSELEQYKLLLKKTQSELRDATATIDRITHVNQNSLTEIEKRERRTLERKLSEMEEELKCQKVLQAENQRLKDENAALIRVISKLSK